MTKDKTVTVSREFKAGFTDPVGDCGKFEASIDVDSWGARIAVYGDTAEDAEQLRAEVMAKLAASIVEADGMGEAVDLPDHEFRETVNRLRAISEMYGHTGQLRERISIELRACLDKVKELNHG